MSPAERIKELFRSDIVTRSIGLSRHELLRPAGTADTDIYYVESGSLRIFIPDGDDERIVRFAYSDNIFVSLDSFLSGKPSDFCIQAIKKSVLKVIRKSDFMDFIHSDPENLRFWNVVLEDLVLQQVEREKDLLTGSPKERYERVLKRSPQLFREIPERHIANYLRMSAETLSRLKNS
jgi:CRP/FNR family transcriptional regulator, anaerobic regulatory protein